MKSTGFVRRVDNLGRVVIPKEIRRTLFISEGAFVEMYFENGEVHIRKFDSCINFKKEVEMLRDLISEDSFCFGEKSSEIKEHLKIISDIIDGTTKAFE